MRDLAGRSFLTSSACDASALYRATPLVHYATRGRFGSHEPTAYSERRLRASAFEPYLLASW
jgi:hypothetical protein